MVARRDVVSSLTTFSVLDDADLRAQVGIKPGFVLSERLSPPAGYSSRKPSWLSSQSDHAAGHSRESGQSIEAENALAAAQLAVGWLQANLKLARR